MFSLSFKKLNLEIRIKITIKILKYQGNFWVNYRFVISYTILILKLTSNLKLKGEITIDVFEEINKSHLKYSSPPDTE